MLHVHFDWQHCVHACVHQPALPLHMPFILALALLMYVSMQMQGLPGIQQAVDSPLSWLQLIDTLNAPKSTICKTWRNSFVWLTTLSGTQLQLAAGAQSRSWLLTL